MSFAHTHPARSLPCNRSQLALSVRCLPSASTTRSTALRNTCIYAQVRFSWRFGLAPFIAYSGTHTSHTRCHTCYLCIRISPFCSYSALIHSQAHTLIRTHVSRGVVRSCWSICQWSSRLSDCTTFRGLRYLHVLRGYACTRPCLRSMRAGVLVNVGGNQPPHVRKFRTFLRLGLASLRESCAGTQPLLRVWVRSRLARLLLRVFHKIAAHTIQTNLCAAALPP